MTLLIYAFLFVGIAMPLVMAWRLWRLDEPTRVGWLIHFADALAFALLILLLNRWDIAGIWTGAAIAAVLILAAARSFRKHRGRPWRGADAFWRRYGPYLASLLLFGGTLLFVLHGMLVRDAPQDFDFPLKGGTFLIAHGGGNGLLNHHSSHRAQHHALDISALNSLGFRASGVLPRGLDRYAIFGSSVVSPCQGRVTEVRDDLPDLTPPRTDRAHAAGNHIVISCNGLRVELAHLRRGSTRVAAGNPVKAGDVIAAVGNSGNTTEPHLHIHAVDRQTGRGVQMRFEGWTPPRNAIFRR